MSEENMIPVDMEECAEMANEMAKTFLGKSMFAAVGATILLLRSWKQNYPDEVELIEEAFDGLTFRNNITLRNGEDA